MERWQRLWSRGLSQVSRRTRRLEKEVALLRDRERLLRIEMEDLRFRVLGSPPIPSPEDPRGPVIHVYLVNGQDFYGVVKSMDDESFTIALSNTAGRMLVIPKRSILYYRMKY